MLSFQNISMERSSYDEIRTLQIRCTFTINFSSKIQRESIYSASDLFQHWSNHDTRQAPFCGFSLFDVFLLFINLVSVLSATIGSLYFFSRIMVALFSSSDSFCFDGSDRWHIQRVLSV